MQREAFIQKQLLCFMQVKRTVALLPMFLVATVGFVYP